jgi:hypothetical protein
MSSEQSQVRTHMFARVLGPYFTIVPATVGVREAYMRTLSPNSRPTRCGPGCTARFF